MQWYICVHSDKTLQHQAHCPIDFVTVIDNTYQNEIGTPANSKLTL